MAAITPLPIAARSSLPLYPNGWFAVAESEDLTADRMTPLTYFGRHLIAFRTAADEVRVADAYCPHLGAHLASHTGSLENGIITCPFHRWQFDSSTGRCVKINYFSAIPPSAALRFYPALEVNGQVLMYFHAEGEAPDHEPYRTTRMDEGPWMKLPKLRWEMHAQQQEFLENIFDSAHIFELHRGNATPHYDSIDETPFGIQILLSIDVPQDPGFPVVKCLNYYTGISLACQNNQGRAENILLTSFTPIDENRVEMVTRPYLRDSGSDEINRNFGQGFIEMYEYEVGQDLAILEHKKHLPQPLVVAGDGPIMRWRRYAQRFYSPSAAA